MVRRILVYWLPPLVWMSVIFFLSAQPDLPHVPGPWLDTLLKKVGHAVAYGLLAWFYLRVLQQYLEGRRSPAMLRAVSAALAVVYAMSDEYHQTFVSGRNGNLLDVMIDGIGACVAMWLDWWMARRRALSGMDPRQASAAQ
jgi:VanZ family protein